MFSIGDARKKLPSDFIQNLYQNLSPHIADQILSGMLCERLTTVRVNTLKYNVHQFMNLLKEENIKFERVLWYSDALILKNAREKDIEKLSVYQEGKIYLQSLSSMIPPLVLNPRKGERILDLTSAPGSKTTQMAMMMNNEGFLLANELDSIRYEKLVYNLNKQGVLIAETRLGKGEKIGELFPESFDRVLLDAPCSGEGLFIVGQSQTTRHWSLKNIRQLSALQKKLFSSAFAALKKGGILVYSTCTLNQEENEDILKWAIEKYNLRILDIPLKISGSFSGVALEGKKDLQKSMRIFPSKNLEGFFICLLKKND